MGLSGIRVLLIEDDALIAMLFRGYLGDLGCQVVASASRLPDALAKAATADIDVAVLDVNLGGQLSFPVGVILKERHIPFVFAPGYDGLVAPDDLKAAPVLPKPFKLKELEQALTAALALCSGDAT